MKYIERLANFTAENNVCNTLYIIITIALVILVSVSVYTMVYFSTWHYSNTIYNIYL